MALAQRAPQEGALLRGYRLLAALGSGPSGQVFRARDEARAREVVVKLFHPHRSAPEALARHAEIARAAAAVPRSTACDVVELVTDSPTPFMAVEAIDGVDLTTLLRQRGPLPWAQGQALLLRCAAALEAVHRAGIAHTGLKPGNIRVIGDPGPGRAAGPVRLTVRLLDFGVGALLELGNTGATRVHDDLSADYLSPEELRGEPPGPAADIYRLGVIFFELLTGHRPFEGRVQEVVRHHQRTPPPSPRSLAPTLPPEADALLFGLLEKAPERRTTAAELRARLAGVHLAGRGDGQPPRRARNDHEEEAPTAMWMRSTGASTHSMVLPEEATNPTAGDLYAEDEPTATHTVVLMNPTHLPPANPGEVTLIPEGMGGEFLIQHLANQPNRASEQTSVLTNTSATVFVDRSKLQAAAPAAPTIATWRRKLAGPWSFERKLLTINVAFGLLILLGLLMLARSA